MCTPRRVGVVAAVAAVALAAGADGVAATPATTLVATTTTTATVTVGAPTPAVVDLAAMVRTQPPLGVVCASGHAVVDATRALAAVTGPQPPAPPANLDTAAPMAPTDMAVLEVNTRTNMVRLAARVLALVSTRLVHNCVVMFCYYQTDPCFLLV